MSVHEPRRHEVDTQSLAKRACACMCVSVPAHGDRTATPDSNRFVALGGQGRPVNYYSEFDLCPREISSSRPSVSAGRTPIGRGASPSRVSPRLGSLFAVRGPRHEEKRIAGPVDSRPRESRPRGREERGASVRCCATVGLDPRNRRKTTGSGRSVPSGV